MDEEARRARIMAAPPQISSEIRDASGQNDESHNLFSSFRASYGRVFGICAAARSFHQLTRALGGEIAILSLRNCRLCAQKQKSTVMACQCGLS
jgi:hypothetical protein